MIMFVALQTLMGQDFQHCCLLLLNPAYKNNSYCQEPSRTMGKSPLELAVAIYHYGSLNIYYNHSLYKTTTPLLPEAQA